MAEAVAAGNKAAAVEEVEGKPAGDLKKTKKVKVLVEQKYIDYLLAHPPRLKPRRRLDEFFQHPAESQAELEFREAFFKLEAQWELSKKEYDEDMAILEEYCMKGCAYEEIDGDEVVVTE